MKILMLTTSYPKWPGETTAPFIEEIAAGVAARGHEVHVLMPYRTDLRRAPIERGVHLHTYHYAPHPSLEVWGYAAAMQGDIGLQDYVDYVRTQRAKQARVLCLYASDAEIFDFRPGRYKTEEKIAATGEWNCIAQAFARLSQDDDFALIAPSDALRLRDARDAGQKLHLESAACPVPVKKQRKYALARWAVTGRDDVAINAACQRIHDGLVAKSASSEAWKELCYLWSSDFRTHITDKRWNGFVARLRAMQTQWASYDRPATPAPQGGKIESRYIDIETPALKARLDRRRGLAIESLQFAGHPTPVVGGLRHGHFDDIALQADWYTGDCVFEAPGEHKLTDLE